MGNYLGTLSILGDFIVSRNRDVKSVLKSRRSLAGFIGYLRHHLGFVLIGISLLALILFPLADCFDCEGLGPWGRNDAAYATRSMVFDYWLVGASLLAGASRHRFSWTVPVAITLIACATEPLGGVAIWSLFSNEGPVMLIFGGSLGMASFVAGLSASVTVDRLRKHHLRT